MATGPMPAAPGKKEDSHGLKIGIAKHIGALITGQVEISKSDVMDMLDTLELEMLEGDVAIEVAEQIKREIEARLVGKKIRKAEMNPFVRSAIKEALVGVMETGKDFDLVERVKSLPKPVKVLVLGVNGAGKSTTIAKIAKMLIDSEFTVVLAASDTFRAAAIEQLSVHAERLGVRMIKREYGSDPTAVAYDAANYAKAHGIDVVLIDTAGSQDTNSSLINELKKMNRVIAPEIKIYVGESIAGNAIVGQIAAFGREIGVDGIILTKLDCDPKGGSILSISRITGIPVIYLGTGQAYGDLERFSAEGIADRILG
jgi:fused signal recognition particle receptor